MARNGRAFCSNDFDAIYAKYFERIIANGLVAGDPSGWARTQTEIKVDLPSSPRSEAFSNYTIDNRRLLGSQKESLVSLLEKWDHQPYSYDEITITPSISTASLTVLLLLRSRGIRTIFFETPAYYATIEQAASIGIRCRLIPTYRRNRYNWTPTSIRRNGSRTAIWLTQPRFALGANQQVKHVEAVLDLLGVHDFLVVDETADMLWPSTLSKIRTGATRNLIKIRGYTKPLGLNGLRTSFVIHPASLRSALCEFLWIAGGALDLYSLMAAVQIASDANLFQSMLSLTRNRIIEMHRRLSALTTATYVSLSPMENGYLGSAILNWSNIQGEYARKRQSLLEFCSELRLPITLGAAMLFAYENSHEHVRLNYFMPGRDLELGISALTEFSRRLSIQEFE